MMEERVKKIIIEVLKKEGKETSQQIDYSTRLREDLGFDSLMLAVLTVIIEDEFGIDIFEDGLVETFGEIVEILKKKV